MDKVGIQTTQNVTISYEVASIGERLLAAGIDYLLLMGYAFIIWMVAISTKFFGEAYWVFIILGLPPLFYHLVMEAAFNGQSLGKLVMKIKVVKLDGSRPTFGNYLVRWAFRLFEIDAFQGGLALVALILSSKGQRLGDMAAKTSVIKTGRRVKLQDTILHRPPTERQIRFPQVARLSDRDMAIIKGVMTESVRSQNWPALEKLARKTKDTLGVESEMPHIHFLETVLADYNQFKFEEDEV